MIIGSIGQQYSAVPLADDADIDPTNEDSEECEETETIGHGEHGVPDLDEAEPNRDSFMVTIQLEVAERYSTRRQKAVTPPSRKSHVNALKTALLVASRVLPARRAYGFDFWHAVA